MFSRSCKQKTKHLPLARKPAPFRGAPVFLCLKGGISVVFFCARVPSRYAHFFADCAQRGIGSSREPRRDGGDDSRLGRRCHSWNSGNFGDDPFKKLVVKRGNFGRRALVGRVCLRPARRRIGRSHFLNANGLAARGPRDMREPRRRRTLSRSGLGRFSPLGEPPGVVGQSPRIFGGRTVIQSPLHLPCKLASTDQNGPPLLNPMRHRIDD